jgi:hypothetical protein
MLYERKKERFVVVVSASQLQIIMLLNRNYSQPLLSLERWPLSSCNLTEFFLAFLMEIKLHTNRAGYST